ncbi:MAG: MltR family transcriptional regulator [Methylococcaceae bacterium]
MVDIDFNLLRTATELKGESDRAAAIVGTSVLETHLEQLLTKAMIDHKKVPDIFKGYAPLSTLSAKINISYFLGLIPTDLYEDLDYIRKIRNDFAHEHGPISFKDQSLADKVKKLKCIQPWLNIQRQINEEHLNLNKVEESENTYKLADNNEEPRNLWNLAVAVLTFELDGSTQLCQKHESPCDAFGLDSLTIVRSSEQAQ